MGDWSRLLLEVANSAAGVSTTIWRRCWRAAAITQSNSKTPGCCYCVASSHEAWRVVRPGQQQEWVPSLNNTYYSHGASPLLLFLWCLVSLMELHDDWCQSVSLEYVLTGSQGPSYSTSISSSRSSIPPSQAESSIVATTTEDVKAGQQPSEWWHVEPPFRLGASTSPPNGTSGHNKWRPPRRTSSSTVPPTVADPYRAGEEHPQLLFPKFPCSRQCGLGDEYCSSLSWCCNLQYHVTEYCGS